MSARQRILRAAARVYLRKGPAATIEEIAAEAEYSPGALYKHFAGKDAIFEALATEISETLVAMFQSPPPVDLNFEQRIKWVLYRLCEYAESERDLFVASVMTSASIFAAAKADQLIQNKLEIEQTLIEMMQQGIDEGVLRSDVRAQLYSMAFGGMLNGLHLKWIFGADIDLQASTDELFQLFLEGAAAPGSR